MPRESRAADQRRLAEEHAAGTGQGAGKRGRGRPKKSKEEAVSAAWEVLRRQYSEEAHATVVGLKQSGLTIDDLVALEIAELAQVNARRAKLPQHQQGGYQRLSQVAMQCRKQLMRLLVLRGGGVNVNDAEVRIPEGLDILERPALPIIGDDVLAKPDLSALPERYR